MDALEERVRRIEERNRYVEKEKAWETSYTRRMIIALLTYLVVVLFFFSAQLPSPWINALVPTMGFLLSTLSLPLFKGLWMKRNIIPKT